MKTILALLLAAWFAQLSLFAVPAEKGSLVEKDRALTWGFTPDPSLPNVLILGDSISIGYTLQGYSKNIELIVDQLKATEARLVFATTTPVVEGTLNPLREPDAPGRYNAAALEVMKANDIRVNDLYAFTEPHLAEWQLPKNVHFNPAGSAALAKQVATVITEELNLTGVGLPEGDSDTSKSNAAKKEGAKYLDVT